MIKLLFLVVVWTLIAQIASQGCVHKHFADLNRNETTNSLQSVSGTVILFPEYRFFCSGRITGWEAIVQFHNLFGTRLQFQVWRWTSPQNYTLIASLEANRRFFDGRLSGVAVGDLENNHVFVERGDIVGVLTPPSPSHSLYAETPGASITYFVSVAGLFNPTCTFEACSSDVTIGTRTLAPRFKITIDSNETGVNSIQPMCNPWLFNECSGTIPTLVPTLPPDPSDLPSDPNTDGSSDAVVGIVVGTVFGLLILAGVITLVIVGIIVWRRWRKEGTYETNTSRNVNHYDIKGSTQVQNGEPDYATLDRGRVGTSASSRHYEFESEPVPNPVYRPSFSRRLNDRVSQEPATNGSINRAHEYAILDGKSPEPEVPEPFPYAVPLIHGDNKTSSLQVKFSTLPEGYKEDAMYSEVTDPSQTNENPYEQPSNNEQEIYASLDKAKYMGINPISIQLGSFLGKGHFAVVHKGLWLKRDGPQEVAVKQLRENASSSDRVKFLQEAAIMGQFKHPGIIRLYGVVKEEKPMIILEYLPNGDLHKYLLTMRPGQENYSKNSEKILLKFGRQIASGMNYLSGKGFIHRDLAARNILVTEGSNCKIADFGMSRDLASEDYYITSGGKVPLKWTAPEAIHFKKYSSKSDVWSFGVVLYEIWSIGERPYDGISNPEILKQLRYGHRMPPPPGCPRAIYKLMILCWNPSTEDRPTFRAVVSYFAQPDSALLRWAEEEQVSNPEARVLGAPAVSSADLYRDLQGRYVKQSSVAGSEEPPSYNSVVKEHDYAIPEDAQ